MGETTLPKVCFPVAGEPAIVRSIRTYRACGINTIVLVVGAGAGQVLEIAGKESPDLLFAYQAEQRGTGDAARVGFAPLERMGFDGPVMITAGDKVIDPTAVNKLKTGFYRTNSDCAVLVSRKLKSRDQGRVATERGGRVRGIFEMSDIRLAKLCVTLKDTVARGLRMDSTRLRELCLAALSEPEKLARRLPTIWALAQKDGVLEPQELGASIPPGAESIAVGREAMAPGALESMCKLTNESFYMFDPQALAEGLKHLTTRSGRDEEYLPDVVNILADPQTYRIRSEPVVRAVVADRPEDIQGFNTPDQLMAIEQYVTTTRKKRQPKIRPSVPLGRSSLRPAREWLRLFTEMPTRFRSTLKKTYGEADDAIQEHRAAYTSALKLFARKYGADTRAIVVRAPGSANLMGRHVDNRGGQVNLMNVGREVIMVAAPRDDDRFCLSNVDRKNFPDAQFSLREEVAQLDWDDWLSYVQSSRVRRMALDTKGDWSNYVKAAVLRLQQHFRQVPVRGLNCTVHGNIPPGAGLGASAAMLVAAADACIALNGLNVSPRAFIDLCGEGEWYVSGESGSSTRAGMKVGGPGQLTTVRHLPFEVRRSVTLPDNYRLAICHCEIPARRARLAPALKRQQIATFDLALLLIKDRFPQYAHLLDHLRDVNPQRLGATQRALYSMLLALPVRAAPEELNEMLSAAHRERFNEIAALHEAPESYCLRDATLFCMAECARSERFAELLAEGRVDEVGVLMSRSHDAERLVSLEHSGLVPYTWSATDERVSSLIADLESEEPERVSRAQLYMQPGRYGCGAPEVDEMADLARRVEGVVGAQLSGVGLAGCVMVLIEERAVERLKRTLKSKFYAPHKMRPDLTICTPIDRAGVLGA